MRNDKDICWLKEYLKDYIQTIIPFTIQPDIKYSTILINNILSSKDLILKAKKKKKKLIFLGNGASNTIADHAHLDFMNQLNITCLSFSNPSIITAFSNDFGYNFAMKRFLQFYANKDDVIILISSSGESKNIYHAANQAINMKCKLITFSGFKKDNTLLKLGNINFWAPSDKYNIVESTHSFWITVLCDILAKEEKNNGKHGRVF